MQSARAIFLSEFSAPSNSRARSEPRTPSRRPMLRIINSIICQPASPTLAVVSPLHAHGFTSYATSHSRDHDDLEFFTPPSSPTFPRTSNYVPLLLSSPSPSYDNETDSVRSSDIGPLYMDSPPSSVSGEGNEADESDLDDPEELMVPIRRPNRKVVPREPQEAVLVDVAKIISWQRDVEGALSQVKGEVESESDDNRDKGNGSFGRVFTGVDGALWLQLGGWGPTPRGLGLPPARS